MDHLSHEKRSWNMSRIRSEKTKPEETVACYLREHHMGYRRSRKDLPGKPDFVLSKYRAVIFVNGCFWHRHDGCSRATMPKSNTEYWEAKFTRNVERDHENYAALLIAGWRVFVIWECELRKDAEVKLNAIVGDIVNGKRSYSSERDLK